MTRHAPFDVSLALARDPYRFVSRQARGCDGDAFTARLMLRKTVFLTGPAAARHFYSDAFHRAEAAPLFLKLTLFGRGGVQGLDGPDHRARKALFLRLVGPDRVSELTDRVRRGLDRLSGRIAVQDAAERVLTRAVCDWAGVPLPDHELGRRTRMLSELFEHAVPVSPSVLGGITARRAADDWAERLIAAVRSGDLSPPPNTALREIALWRDPAGRRLPPRTAAVELLNVLRPTVAISAFVTFLVHAMHAHPDVAEQMRTAPDATRDRIPDIVQEVRRTAPFFPMLIARARRDTDWDGVPIPAGTPTVLDIWGTNRDARAWAAPGRFSPDRFHDWRGDAFTLIPQGGGDHATGHRCPGEWFTKGIMEEVARWLAARDWQVPPQDLTLDMTSLPGLPRDRMLIDLA
ncbi:cytochrome P450 [Mesobaculum littorinae]|uniref:Cytochrome P450 n=1 Tax=Mesobaculum littorinae TaxID=2486419 RepID=A0A438AIA7_9RHOB|nr:cytochrome P450 [Mesobaculum littorinae]RVV98327.1 cytochrome P450 [Mesobaculum littorinae]